jgi:hypothetical protein
MSSISPTMGGSPLKFKKAREEGSNKEETLALSTGKLVHAYAEDPSIFHIAEDVKPSDMMQKLVEQVLGGVREWEMIHEEKIQFDDTNIILQEIVFEANTMLEKPYKSPKTADKLTKKFVEEGGAYYQHLIDSQGKIMMSKAEHTVVTAIIENLKNDEDATNTLYATPENATDYRECELYWTETIPVPLLEDKKIDLPLKGMADHIRVEVVELTNGTTEYKITLTDIKTGGKPFSNYIESFEKYETFRQLAHYTTGIHRCKKQFNIPEDGKVLIAHKIVYCETSGEHEVVVFDVDPLWGVLGQAFRGDLLQRVAYHEYTQMWHRPVEYKLNGGMYLRFNKEYQSLLEDFIKKSHGEKQ